MWLAQVEIEGHGLVTDDVLSQEEQSDEYLLMGLRLREGVDIHRYEAISGRRLSRSHWWSGAGTCRPWTTTCAWWGLGSAASAQRHA